VAPAPPHRFSYPTEHFSIELPAPWTEIDQATAGLIGSATAVLLPNAPKFKFDHVYTPSNVASGALMVMLNGSRLTDASFKDLAALNHASGDALKGLLSGSIVQNAQFEFTSYDTGRHLLWGTSKGNSVLPGEVRSVIGMYITKVGAIQLSCYSKAAELEKDQAECKDIIGSVKIDPEVELKPPVPLSELLQMPTEQANTTYRQLVERAKAGDLSVDFRALRMACARSNICDKRATPEELAAMVQAEGEKRQSDVVEICERVIGRGFVNMEAHISCLGAYTALNRMDKAKFHRDIVTALFQSFFITADGKTVETAYEVISVKEIYAVLVGKKLPQFGEGVSSAGYAAHGHNYTRYEVKDPKTQEKVVIFFNVDAMAQSK
jgi:hypothetical protein